MAEIWEMLSLTLLGLFGMGQITSMESSSLDIGAYGTSTAGVVEIFFFFAFAAVVFTFLKNYFM